MFSGLAVIATVQITEQLLTNLATDGAAKVGFKAVGKSFELVAEGAKGAKKLTVKLTAKAMKELAKKLDIDLAENWVSRSTDNLMAAIKQALRSKFIKNHPESFWKLHLQELGTDALGKGGPHASWAKPHAHHIAQQGLKNADNKAAQRILEKWDIDWYKGKENLVWAPNEGHTEIYRKVVRKMLEDADALGRAKVIDTLKDLARKFTNERTDWEALARSLNLIP